MRCGGPAGLRATKRASPVLLEIPTTCSAGSNGTPVGIDCVTLAVARAAIARLPGWCRMLPGCSPRPRDSSRIPGGPLVAGQAEHSLGEDVLVHLRGAARDREGPAVHAVARPVAAERVG